MNELEYQAFLGISIHFGGGKPAYWSGTAGVGASYRFQEKNGFGAQLNANAAINFYNGGIGALPGSNKLHIDNVLSGGLTLGGGKGNPMAINPFHLDSGSGMVDNFKYSATLGTNFVLNNSGRNQQVGFVQLRAWKGSLTFYNDFNGFKKLGLADGYDRWWTGGGNLTIGSRNDDFQLIVASDVFTADTDSQILNFTEEELAIGCFPYGDKTKSGYSFDEQVFNTPKPGGIFDKETYQYIPNIAKELDQEYLDRSRNSTIWNQNAHSFNLNQGRTSFRLNTPYGQFGVNGLGAGHMYSQDIIHRMINFHLIPSTQPNSWEFTYKNGFHNE